MKHALILLPLLLNTLSNRTYPINRQYSWDSEDYVNYHYLRNTSNEYYSFEDITMYDGDEQMSWKGKAFSFLVDDGITIGYDSIEIRIFYWWSSWNLYLREIETWYSPNFTGTYKKETAFFKDGFYSYINLNDFNSTTISNIMSSWTSNQKYMYTSTNIISGEGTDTQSQNYNYQEPTNDMNEYSYYVEIYTMTQDQPRTNTDPTTSTLMNVRGQVYYGYDYETVPDNIEVIDLSSLLFDILMMPWAFLSVAFNFTLWPGTPYAINLAHIATVFLGTLVLIFLIKLLLKYIK